MWTCIFLLCSTFLHCCTTLWKSYPLNKHISYTHLKWPSAAAHPVWKILWRNGKVRCVSTLLEITALLDIEGNKRLQLCSHHYSFLRLYLIEIHCWGDALKQMIVFNNTIGCESYHCAWEQCHLLPTKLYNIPLRASNYSTLQGSVLHNKYCIIM